MMILDRYSLFLHALQKPQATIRPGLMRPSKLPDARMIARSVKAGPAMLGRGYILRPLHRCRASMRTSMAMASHPANKSQGPPPVLLSGLVCEQEALLLQLFCEGLQGQATSPLGTCYHTALAAEVQKAARAVLGSSARALIDGSMVKGTQWRGSDVDILVLTAQPVSRSKFLALAEKMKESPAFHPKHVDPGNLAIHVRTTGMDIDVVCANTVEHGIRSLAEERFANNPTAGNAARMVKVMATCAQIAAPVKNYHLELLTLLAQEAAAARGGARVADDSMQLVLDVLQSIADDKMPTTGAAETQADLSKDQFRGLVSGLKDHVQNVLHLFVVSRVLFPPGGWRNIKEVESWLVRPVVEASDSVPTMAGIVPRWLVDLHHDPPVGSSMYPSLLECLPQEAEPRTEILRAETWTVTRKVGSGTKPESSTKPGSRTKPGHMPSYNLTDAQTKDIEQLLQEPLGEYTLFGMSLSMSMSSNTDGASVERAFRYAQSAAAAALGAEREQRKDRSLDDLLGEVDQLKDLVEEVQSEAQRRVAKRMLEVRMLWLTGEVLLADDCSIPAIRTLAKALRLSCRDGDPFYGLWMDTSSENGVLPRYKAAVDSAMSSCPADALLVLGCCHMICKRLDLSEQSCNEGLKHAPDDAYGLLNLRGHIHGNRSEWNLALRNYERAVSLVPSEPIFYFWRAVCKRNMIGDEESLELKEQLLSDKTDYAAFMSQADDGGRTRAERMGESVKAVIKDYELFLNLADEGGRKVPEAHYGIGFISLTSGDPKSSSVQSEVVERVQAARSSELLVLPMLKEKTDSDSKRLCDMIYKVFSAGDKPPTKGIAADMLAFHMNQIARTDDFHIQIQAKQAAEKEAAEAAQRQREMHNATSRINPSLLSCWPQVMFKEAVRIVDPEGEGHFAQLSDALEYVSSTPPPAGSSGWTLVLQPGKYLQCQMVIGDLALLALDPALPQVPTASSQICLQILGGRVTAAEEGSPQHKHGQEPNSDIREPEVTLVYGNLAPGSLKRPFYSNHLAVVVGMSVVMEDLTFVVPDLPGVTAGHCIYLINQAQLYARGCNFSSPKYPCIGAGSGAHCRLIDCCFGPDKERGASAGVVVEGSSNLVAERCLFLRCREAAVEVRGASRGQLKGCKFIKCQKQAVMLYNGGKELVMEDCLIERCGDLTMHHLLLVACGTAQLHKCSFLSNKIDVVMVQCDNQQSAPEVDMRECILKGNMSGVTFGFDEGGRINSGSGILVNNQITDHASYGISIQDVAPNQQVKLIGNVFQDNGPNFGLGKIDILMFQNVQDQVAVKNNRGTIHIRPFSGSDALDVFRRSGRH